MATIALLAVVRAAVVGLILTRPSANSGITTQARGRRPPLVDERPLQSARAMAALASDPDQQRLAQQALRLADHEVDLAFADALRDATEHPVPPKPETRELFARVNKAQAAVKADEDRLDQLKKQLAAAKPDRRDNLQQQIDLIQPRLVLAVGGIAAQNLLATEESVGRLRGHVHRLGERATPLVVTYHPAYLLRSPGEKRKAWTDLKFARAELIRARGH